MSEIKNKGDRLLAGFGHIRDNPRGNISPATLSSSEREVAGGGNKELLPQAKELLPQAKELLPQAKELLRLSTAQMTAREAETQQLRDAMLAAGVNEELVSDPEGAEMDHLEEDEQEEFNDAVREHRTFHQELERDLRELQRSRDALGIRHNENVVRPPMTKETES